MIPNLSLTSGIQSQFNPSPSIFSPNSYNSTGDNTMPAVKPPEWDAMSAKEQLLWYLERLCAMAEEMSTTLGVARVSDPRIATSLVDPAASTTMHASSAPVHEVSCSTTKSQEIPTVTHDGAPACIAMVPVTCSMECSTQVDTIDSIDEVHGAATAVHLEPTVDPIHQAVEQLALVEATTSIGTTPSSAEVVSLVTTTTAVPPKANMQELDALSVDTSTQLISKADHGVALIIFGNPVLPVLAMCSTDGLVQDGEWGKHVHLVDKSKTSCLPLLHHRIGQQPWPPLVRVRTRHSGHL